MEKEFIPYEQALALKELGFDQSCFGFYNIKGDFIKDFGITRDIIENLEIKSIELHRKICLTLTFSQSFRWFREKYGLNITILPNCNNEWYRVIHKINPFEIVELPNLGHYKYSSYEEAELECLKKLIEIVKK